MDAKLRKEIVAEVKKTFGEYGVVSKNVEKYIDATVVIFLKEPADDETPNQLRYMNAAEREASKLFGPRK